VVVPSTLVTSLLPLTVRRLKLTTPMLKVDPWQTPWYLPKSGVDAIVIYYPHCLRHVLSATTAGLWSTDEALAATKLLKWLVKALADARNKKYFEGLKSQIADFKDTGPRGGGSLLLHSSSSSSSPWRTSILPVPFGQKENGCNNTGATGYGVRTGELGTERH